MKACIYARTCRAEKGAHTTAIPRQVEYCMDLSRKHNLTIRHDNIFSDEEAVGTAPPTCWSYDPDEAVRPALAGMIEAIERGGIDRVIVRRPEKLGTAHGLLDALRQFFNLHGVRVIIEPQEEGSADPRGIFAAQVLGDCIQFETDLDEGRRQKLKARKLEEIKRLRDRLVRLEAEVANL